MSKSLELSTTLSELLEEIQINNSNDAFQKLIKIMQSQQMKELTKRYLQLDWDGDVVNMTLLKNILKACNTIYNYSGEETGLSDSEYDSLLEFYKDNSNDDSIITEPMVNGKDDKVNHKYMTLRGTLDKIYKLTEDDVLKNNSQKSIHDWIETTCRKYESVTGKQLDALNLDIIVMPKFDGVSVVFEFDMNNKLQRALTRGDTSRNKATDITHIFKDVDIQPPISNPEYEYGHKTEVMMTDENLEIVNSMSEKKFKNTRSIVSSILNSNEPDERAKYLKIIPLRCSYMKNGVEGEQFLSPAVFNYPYLKCKLGDFEEIREFAFNHKWVNNELRCDGAVIYIIDPEVQKVLGRENEKQKFEVAFKYTEETGYRKVKGIGFTVGLFGRITPVVNFKPIKLKGNTVENASLGSYKRLLQLKLAKDDIIKISYDIIPYADFDISDPECQRSNNEEILPPLVCPECDSELELNDNGGILYCKNPKCPCRKKGRILNYCKKMNIAGISYATVNTFYELGILKNIEDLYTLKDHINTIIDVEGYGPKKITKIIDEIEKHREVVPSVLFASIGIEGLSILKFRKIFSMISDSELIEIALDGNETFFTCVPGIKEKTAVKLVKGIQENEELIMALYEELKILPEPKVINGDFNVIFTKTRNDELERFIKESGGVVLENINQSVNFVVVPNLEVTSSKVKYAKKHNIPIVPENEVIQYVRENYL